jgi:hypothetical protein
MKASHSAGVNFRTRPWGWRLFLTLMASSPNPATSTQLPLW